MNIILIRSDKIYTKMMNAPREKRDDIYRYEMMKPFAFKWSCINVPIKAKKKGGYDVVMASSMLGYLPPSDVDEAQKKNIELISQDDVWKTCEETIQRSLECFTNAGYHLPVRDYRFALMLANPESPYVIQSDGYGGDGGIPGYIFVAIVPSEYTLSKLPAVLAHECNHNIRFQFEEWRTDITLAEMMICEGLAEHFATYLYGDDVLGPWVSKTDMETLNDSIKPIIQDGLEATGLENITAYLYGDEFTQLQGYSPVGLPYCAGYACGYYMIRDYLRKTRRSIVEATLTSADEIMKELGDFWEKETEE